MTPQHQTTDYGYPQLVHYLDAVSDTLKEILASLSGTLPATLLQIGKQALTAPGKVMAAELMTIAGEDPRSLPLPRWPLQVILAYQAVLPEEERSTWRRALPAAAAYEIVIAATDLLDELADEDPSPVVRLYGPGQALNTANVLLVIAQHTLLKDALGAGGERALRALESLFETLLQAGGGQHLDMLYSTLGPNDVDLDMSAHVTSLKAGALIGGACRVGALMAGAEGEVLELLTRLGKETGGIAQIINDIQDVLPQAATASADEVSLAERKTDLLLRKRTLPIVFTLREEGEKPNALQRAFDSGDTQPGEDELTQAILEGGGIQFAQLIIEVHRQNIRDVLDRLEALRPGSREILAPLIIE